MYGKCKGALRGSWTKVTISHLAWGENSLSRVECTNAESPQAGSAMGPQSVVPQSRVMFLQGRHTNGLKEAPKLLDVRCWILYGLFLNKSVFAVS